MTETIAIITPCYKAERWIGAAVRSVVAQTYPHWEHWIISDDGVDYEPMLAAENLRDPRLKFVSSGTIGGGASRARNVALDSLTAPYAAILDADDRFKPDKLKQAVAALQHHAIVSVALDEFDETGKRLRLVGQGQRTLARHLQMDLAVDGFDDPVGSPQNRRPLRPRAYQHDRSGTAVSALPHGAR
jgi:glycosyltransferase involved in cell wall biosynthesis